MGDEIFESKAAIFLDADGFQFGPFFGALPADGPNGLHHRKDCKMSPIWPYFGVFNSHTD